MDGIIEAAMSNALTQAKAGFLGKWVAVCEAINEDGQRAVWTFSQEDSQAQDTLALHNYALELLRAAFVRDAMKDQD
jgi:hypothetical protein